MNENDKTESPFEVWGPLRKCNFCVGESLESLFSPTAIRYSHTKKLMTTGSVVDVKWPDITVGEQREHNCYAREGTNFLCHDND